MNHFSHRERSAAIAALRSEKFDVMIIGGGITGAGLALDAAARSLRTGLVEKRDFGSGTSSRSTKLIHGGLRYLEHFEFALVREGLEERSILARTAPHLVEPFPFLIPIYKDRKRNYSRPFQIRLGLIFYDLLAGKRGYGKHRRLDLAKTLELAPQLDPDGLEGSLVYYDGITDDSRLVIEVMKSAHGLGASPANYVKATGLLRDNKGKVTGVRLHDQLTGDEWETHSSIVISATGIWTDELRKPAAQVDGDPEDQKRVRPSKGVHIVFSSDRLDVKSACLIPARNAHRFYFVVPWEDRVVVGTTDTDYRGDWDSPRAEANEVSEILNAIRSYFPAAKLEMADVISSFAGLRPLVSDGSSASKDVSRKEEIFQGRDGLISLAGGKLTTYRRMAERAIDLAIRKLNPASHTPTRSDVITVGGGAIDRDELDASAVELARIEHLPPATARHLITAYGSDYRTVVDLARDTPGEELREDLVRPLVSTLPHMAIEVLYAIRHEMAMTLADVLARRMRLAILAGKEVLDCGSVVADLMAKELGWSDSEKARQLEAFINEVRTEYLAALGSGFDAEGVGVNSRV